MEYNAKEVGIWLETMAAGTVSLLVDNIALARDAVALLRSTGAQPEDDQLSENFTLSELTYSDTALAQGIDNSPGEAEIDELEMLAQITLEGIRKILGGMPMQITSGYRCPELNTAIGGAANSAHIWGSAADFVVTGLTPLDACRAIEPHMVALEIDQLIHENQSWIHVGRAAAGSKPRHESLTIDNGRTVVGIV